MASYQHYGEVKIPIAVDSSDESVTTRESVESYAYGNDNLIFWNQSYDYNVLSKGGKSVWNGKLTGEDAVPFKNSGEKIPEEDEKHPLTMSANCNWFTPMKNFNHMLYVSFVDKSTANLNVWDFDQKKVVETFAKNLPIERRFFHNWCWLRFNEDDNTAQLAFSANNKCQYFGLIKKGQDGGQPIDINFPRPSHFFEKDNTMLMTCNYPENPQTLEFHCLSKGANSTFKVTFPADHKVTILDFGFLNARTLFFVGTIGEQGKFEYEKKTYSHSNVCYLWNLGDIDLKNYDGEFTDLKFRILDLGEEQVQDEVHRKAWLCDGWCKLNPSTNELSMSCTGHKWLTYHFKNKDGELIPELKAGHEEKDKDRRSGLRFYQAS